MPDGAGPARTVVLAGAGGTGKTTVACALAAHAAAAGPALLITVGRVIEPLLADPAAARSFDHVHLNPTTLLANWWSAVVATARAGRAAAAPAAGIDPFVLEPAELTTLADAEHLLTLREVHRHASSGAYRTVVLDGPGFEELVALLGAPDAISAYLERAWPRHVRLAAPVSGAAPATGTVAGLVLAERLTTLAENLAAFVGDRGAVNLLYVCAADGARVARARAELQVAEVLGLRPAALVLTRVHAGDARYADDLPHPAVQWYARRLAQQRRASTGVQELADALARPMLTVTEASSPPADVADAAALTIAGIGDPGNPLPVADAGAPEATARVTDLGGDGVDRRYRWTLPLALIDPATIELGRVEEDLIVSAHGVRRRMRLPSVLRRCVVTGAGYTDSELRVGFAPDPQVWPK